MNEISKNIRREKIYKNDLFFIFFLISISLFVISKYLGLNFTFLNEGKNFFLYNTKIFNINIPYYLFLLSYAFFCVIYYKQNAINVYEIIFLSIILLLIFFTKNKGYILFVINYSFLKFFFQKKLNLNRLIIFYKILIILFCLIFYQKHLNKIGLNILELPFHFSLVTNSISYLLYLSFLLQIFYLIRLNKFNYSIFISFFLILFLTNSFIKILSFLSIILYFFYFFLYSRYQKILNYNFKLLLLLIIIFVFFTPFIFISSYFIEILHNFYLFLLKSYSNFVGIIEKNGCDELVDKLLYSSDYLSRNLQLKYPVLCFNYTGEPPFYGMWIGLLERIQILKDCVLLNFSNNFEFNNLINSLELKAPYFSHNSYLNLAVVYSPLFLLTILFSKLYLVTKFVKKIDFVQFFIIVLILFSHLTDDYFYGNRAEISFLSFILLGIVLNQKNKI